MYTLIGTTKLNELNLLAWIADVLDQITELPNKDCPSFVLELGNRIESAEIG